MAINKELSLKEKVELLDKLMEEYEERENDDISNIAEQINALHLDEVDFIYNLSNTRGELYVCPDCEWELPFVFEIANEHVLTGVDVISSTILKYYRHTDFYDNATNLDICNLLKIYTRLHKLPIIRYFPPTEVNLLNVRWLNANR